MSFFVRGNPERRILYLLSVPGWFAVSAFSPSGDLQGERHQAVRRSGMQSLHG